MKTFAAILLVGTVIALAIQQGSAKSAPAEPQMPRNLIVNIYNHFEKSGYFKGLSNVPELNKGTSFELMDFLFQTGKAKLEVVSEKQERSILSACTIISRIGRACAGGDESVTYISGSCKYVFGSGLLSDINDGKEQRITKIYLNHKKTVEGLA